jgi:hypothetical protein
MTGEAGRSAFKLYPDICPTTEEKHRTPQWSWLVWYGCEIWSLQLREEQRLEVSDNMTTGYLEKYLDLRKLLNDKRLEKNYIMRSFVICTLHQILLR